MTELREPSSGRLIWGAGESCADMLYASGLQTPDPFLWYSVPGETGIVVNALEYGRALKTVRPGVRVRLREEAAREWGARHGGREVEDLVAGLARSSGIRMFRVPADFPLRLADRLRRRRVRLHAVETFFPERRLKSPAETECIRAGVALAEAGLARALDVLAAATTAPDGGLVHRGAPLTAEILRGEIDAEIARAGGTGSHTIAAPGVQGADPHCAGSGPVRAGEPIVLDIFPRVDATGYFGDLTRTVVKGTPPPVFSRAYVAVAAAQQAALEMIRAGVSAKAVHDRVRAVLDAAGFETDAGATPPRGFFHGTGHGLGLEIHEAPRLSERNDEPLRAGDVVTVEPGVYYPEWGGVRLEDVVLVTETGCENLTRAAKTPVVP